MPCLRMYLPPSPPTPNSDGASSQGDAPSNGGEALRDIKWTLRVGSLTSQESDG